MELSHYLYCLWPGLPELWFRGRWTGLPAAATFAIALNILLVARFIYPQWLEPFMVRVFCWALVALWAVMFIRAVRSLPELLVPRQASGTEDLYDQARCEYLKGCWFEAEALLSECLNIDDRDAQALLLLASVYRHTGRLEAAAHSLAALNTLESGDRWALEREIELRRLARMQDELTESEENADNMDQENSEADEVRNSDNTTAFAQASTLATDSSSEKIAAELASTDADFPYKK